MAETYQVDSEKLKNDLKEELLKQKILMGLNNENEEEIDLYEFFAVLKRRWKSVILIPFFVACIAAVVALLIPNRFKASSTIFVHQGKGGSVLSSLGALSSFINLPSSGGGQEYLLAYLKSRTMSERIINKFGIATNTAIVGPNPETELEFEKVLKILGKVVSINEGKKDSLITVSAETKSPELSAEIAREYVKDLALFAKGPNKKKRLFIEEQIKKVSVELAAAEEKFKAFQDEHKMFTLETQASEVLSKLAKLEAEKVSSGIQLKMHESLLKSSGSVPELVQIEAQKVAEEAKTEALQKEIESAEAKIALLPQVGLDFARYKRSLMVKEKVFTVLTEQYETAKIAEAEEASAFEVIDVAKVPQVKSSPKRAQICIISALLALFLVVGFHFVKFSLKKHPAAKSATEP